MSGSRTPWGWEDVVNLVLVLAMVAAAAFFALALGLQVTR